MHEPKSGLPFAWLPLESRAGSPLSMMPEGQLDPLTMDEVRDLFAYLASPVQVPLPGGKK